MIRLCSSSHRLALAVAVASLVVEGVPATVFAADAPSSFPASSPNAQSAEKLAEKAYELHGAGKFAEAIATYLQAYAISNAAAVLFNVATIYDRKLHESALAADYYRRYLGAADVEPDLVQKANSRLAALKQADEEAKAREAAVPPVQAPPPVAPVSSAPPPPPPSPVPTARVADTSAGSGWRKAAIVVGGVGVAGLGASVVLAVVAKGKNDDANAFCNGAACSNAQGVSLAHDAGTFATASTVAFVAGAALAVGGVVVYLAAPSSSTSAASTGSYAAWGIAPVIVRAGGGLSMQAGF
jgi:tetratricopeptide (TPR) repeat protein